MSGRNRTRSRNQKPNAAPPASADAIPLAKPSSTTRRAPGKPLIDLTEDDLRAAGVQFHHLKSGETVAGKGAGDWADEIRKKAGGRAGVPKGRTGVEDADEDDDEEEEEEEDNGGESGGDDGDDEAEDDERDKAVEAFWDEFFDALMWTVPFSFLYLMLDILTNLSYAKHPPFAHYLKNYILSAPTIGFIVFYTTRHASSIWVRGILTAASIASGTRLVWLVNKASYLVVIQQAPAMGTIWILTIVQLPLSLAVAALATVFAWLYQAKLKVIP